MPGRGAARGGAEAGSSWMARPGSAGARRLGGGGPGKDKRPNANPNDATQTTTAPGLNRQADPTSKLHPPSVLGRQGLMLIRKLVRRTGVSKSQTCLLNLCELWAASAASNELPRLGGPGELGEGGISKAYDKPMLSCGGRLCETKRPDHIVLDSVVSLRTCSMFGSTCPTTSVAELTR